MDVFSPLPSDLNKTFYHLLKEDSIKATDFYYKLSQDNNYIKKDRIDDIGTHTEKFEYEFQ